MKTPPYLETFKVMLDGLDVWLIENVSPRRRKLQVLDLQNGHHNLQNTWSGAQDGGCSLVMSEKQTVEVHPLVSEVKQPLEVLADFHLIWFNFEHEKYLLPWAQLCCRELQTGASSLIHPIIHTF